VAAVTRSTQRYIVPKNWSTYQHYKTQTRPPWIKLYVHLLHDDEWLSLTPEQRSALQGIWLLYAESARKLPENTASLSRQLGQRITKRTLKSLSDAGFIEFHSRASLEQLYSNSTLEENRIEKNPLTPSERGNKSLRATGQNPRAVKAQEIEDQKGQALADALVEALQIATAWNGGSSEAFDNVLEEIERDHKTTLPATDRQNLWDVAFKAGA
jgi:hypothetical protein